MGELRDYIISMGHKKIAYIHGQDFSSVTRDRLAAYYRALEKLSLIHILILDEPTNDLDVETLAILEDYLDGYDGIVITVSHDLSLIHI